MWKLSAPLSSTLPLCRSPWPNTAGGARGKLDGPALRAVSNCCTPLSSAAKKGRQLIRHGVVTWRLRRGPGRIGRAWRKRGE